MANTTNYNWETPDDTDLVKDGAAAIRTLGNSIDTTTKNLNPQTTTGAIAYRSASSNVNTALPIGTAGQVLKVNSGATAPEWAIDPTTDVVTTAGDLIYGTGADAVTRLGIGTAGQVLTVNSGATAPQWAAASASTPTFVGCSLYASSDQSIGNATFTAITWNAENYDTNAFHDNSTNNSRITIPSGKGGYYEIYGKLDWYNNATGRRGIRIYKNGTDIKAAWINSSANDEMAAQIYTVISLAATDYIEIFGYQNSGGNLSIYKNEKDSEFTISLLGV